MQDVNGSNLASALSEQPDSQLGRTVRQLLAGGRMCTPDSNRFFFFRFTNQDAGYPLFVDFPVKLPYPCSTILMMGRTGGSVRALMSFEQVGIDTTGGGFVPSGTESAFWFRDVPTDSMPAGYKFCKPVTKFFISVDMSSGASGAVFMATNDVDMTFLRSE
jgi:hypothetical protein